MRAILAALLPALLLAPFVQPGPAAAQDAGLPPGLAQDYDPAPALWRLADEDTTIYMMGTIHLLPEGFRWRNPQLDAIVEAADELVVESTDDDAEAMIALVDGKFSRLLEGRTPTSQRLSPAARNNWRRLVEAQGLSFEYADTMPLVLALMGFGGMEPASAVSTYEHGVETVLEAEFKASGRPIGSIEDTGRVMMALYRLDDRELLAELEQALIGWDGRMASAMAGLGEDTAASGEWMLEHAWARGRLQDEVDMGFGQGKAGAGFRRVLLTDRNRRWAEWLARRLEQPGEVLLAVGAAHFEGRDSLLTMLEDHGLAPERLNSPVD